MLKITNRFWIILGLFIISLLGWIFYEDEVFIQLTTLTSLIIVACFIWTLLAVIKIDVIRKSRFYRQNVGEYFEENFVINNNLPTWRFWLEIKNFSNLEGYFVSRVISSLGPNQSRIFNSYTLLKSRGAVQLGPISIVSGDPFGLFHSQKEIGNENILLVLPFYEILAKIPLLFGLLMGGNSLRRPSLETTPHAAGIREYYPGDPLNRIHWPSSMKRNQIMVKEFDQDPQASVWIYLDAQKKVNYSKNVERVNDPNEKPWMLKKRSEYQLPCDSFEYAVSIAASLADYFIKQKRSVGFSCSGKNIEILSSDKGERQLSKILEILTFINSDGVLPITGFIESNANYQNLGTTIIVITTSAAVELRDAAEIIKQRGLYPMIILLDAISFGGKGNATKVKENLLYSKIPIANLKYGDQIKDTLQEYLS